MPAWPCCTTTIHSSPAGEVEVTLIAMLLEAQYWVAWTCSWRFVPPRCRSIGPSSSCTAVFPLFSLSALTLVTDGRQCRTSRQCKKPTAHRDNCNHQRRARKNYDLKTSCSVAAIRLDEAEVGRCRLGSGWFGSNKKAWQEGFLCVRNSLTQQHSLRHPVPDSAQNAAEETPVCISDNFARRSSVTKFRMN